MGHQKPCDSNARTIGLSKKRFNWCRRLEQNRRGLFRHWTFDPLAPFYDVIMALFRRRIPEKIISRLELEHGDVVLDIGGGTGYNAARMESACGRVIVLDISFKMLRRAKKYRHLDLVLGDARLLPFKNQCFDAVVAVDSLHHVNDYTAVLKETKRTGRHKVLVAEFYGRTLLGKLLTGLERFFLPVAYKRPDEFCLEASRQGIPGEYEYISSFEYFFLGNIQHTPGRRAC
jgi:ubiquinone/menaquinone biosynthesis C-methylase UbiE